MEKSKFTTNLSSDTLNKLEIIKVNYQIKNGNKLKGINSVIEILADNEYERIKEDGGIIGERNNK